MSETNSKSSNENESKPNNRMIRKLGGANVEQDSTYLYRVLSETAKELEAKYGTNQFQTNNIDPFNSEFQITEFFVSSTSCDGSYELYISYDKCAKVVIFESKSKLNDREFNTSNHIKLHTEEHTVDYGDRPLDIAALLARERGQGQCGGNGPTSYTADASIDISVKKMR